MFGFEPMTNAHGWMTLAKIEDMWRELGGSASRTPAGRTSIATGAKIHCAAGVSDA